MAADDDGSDILSAMAASPAPSGAPAGGGDDGSDILNTMAATQGAHDTAPPPTPPAPRTAGPPRLHVQQHQPRPPPAAPAPEPPAPSWSQVPGLFAQNILPSTGQVLSDTLESLKPTNWGKDIKGLNDLAVGALSKAGVYGGSPAEKKHDQAVLDAFLAAKQQQWWGQHGEGLRRSLAYHPAENLADVASIAAPLAGGAEVAAARLPGLAGDIAGTAARVAGGVEAATNPLGYPARALGVARGLTRTASAATDATDAVDALRRVHPTEDIPNEMVTGEAAPPEASAQVASARTRWRKHVGDAATELAGGQDAPDPAALGSALEDRQIAAHNAGVDAQDVVAAHPGQFYPSFAPTLRNTIETTLAARRLPPTTGPASLEALNNYPRTVEAMNYLNDRVADLANNGALTPKNLMAVRQGLGQFYQGAYSSDFKGVRTIAESLDNHIVGQGEAGVYQGGDGAAVAADMKRAVNARRQYAADFENGPAAKAVQVLRNAQTVDATGRLSASPAGTTDTAGAILGKGLIHPTNLSAPAGAAQLYNHLDGLMGGAGSPGSQAVDDFVRQSVLKTNPETGNLAARPEQVHGFLRSDMSRSVFPNPDEHARVADLANVDRMARAPTAKGTRAAGTMGALIGRAARHGVAIGVGSHFGPWGPFVGEGIASHIIDPWLARRAAQAQFRLPRAMRARRLPGRLGPLSKAATRAALAAHAGWGASYQTPAEQQREAEQDDRAIVAAAPAVGSVVKDSQMGRAPPVTPTDVDTVVRMANAEGDQTPEGWKAVAAVMRNRALESGHSLTDLAAEPNQFEAYGNRNYTGLRAGTPEYARVLAAIAPVLAGKEDPTGGADSYYAPGLQARLGRKKPSWDDGSGQMLGSQLFFKNKYRRAHAAGGEVVDLTERLMRRAETAQKAAKTATKPMLGLSDDVVAKALKVAGAAI